MAKKDDTEAPKPAAETKSWEQWAEAKGHVAKLPKPSLLGPRLVAHTGPDVRVVRAYFGWAIGKQLTAAEYDAAVDLVYNQLTLR